MKSAEAKEFGVREDIVVNGGPPTGYILPSVGSKEEGKAVVNGGPPAGYIFPSFGSKEGGDMSGGPPHVGYIPLESVRTHIDEAAGGPSPGYSDIVLQPGGYIGLSQI